MTKLITNEELEEITKYFVKYESKEEAKKLIKIYHKLINNYKYYKNRVTELELEIADLLDRDEY